MLKAQACETVNKSSKSDCYIDSDHPVAIESMGTPAVSPCGGIFCYQWTQAVQKQPVSFFVPERKMGSVIK